MTALSIEAMSVHELEALKQQVEKGIQAKKQQRVEEAFQKISYLCGDDLRELIRLIDSHLKPKMEPHLNPINPMDCYKDINVLKAIGSIRS